MTNSDIKLPAIDSNTLLAVDRTRFAAERTLMSWIRTSFSMISFGFTIIKFFEFLKDNPQFNSNSQQSGSLHLGLFLILLGLLSLIPGMIEHRKTLSELSRYDGKPTWSYAFIMAVLVGLIGLYALVHVLSVRFF